MAQQGFYLKDNTFIQVGEFIGTTREDAVLLQNKPFTEISIDNHTPRIAGGSYWKYTIVPLLEEETECITGNTNYARTCFFYATHFKGSTPSRQIAGLGRFRAFNTMQETYTDVLESVISDFWGTWGRSGIIYDETYDNSGLKMKSICFATNNEAGSMWCFYKDVNGQWHTSDVPSASPTQLYRRSTQRDDCDSGNWVFRDSSRDTKYGFITDYMPNQGGGISTSGGGDGAFEISSDIIEAFDVSKLISAINTGFMRAYAIKPNEMQLIRDLATYMWTSDFVDNLKKLWGDPMQVIMGLSAIPVTPARGGVQNVVLGNVQSPVAMPPATSQYVVHNCGSITIKKYWGNYLDYKYTKASIYLPFIGGQELDIQKVMGKTLSLAYIIDIVSGACSAQLVADGSVIGNWQGSCAMGLPISAENFSRYYVGALTSAGAGLIKGASAGPIGALAGAITGAAVNSAINPPHVEMNGNVSGAGGYMSCRRPYIQLTLPRQSLAEIYNEIEGYPCNVTYTLGDLTGYTVVANVHLEGIIATADELEEIEELLKGGVIF